MNVQTSSLSFSRNRTPTIAEVPNSVPMEDVDSRPELLICEERFVGECYTLRGEDQICLVDLKKLYPELWA